MPHCLPKWEPPFQMILYEKSTRTRGLRKKKKQLCLLMIPSNILPGSLFWITFLSLIFIGTDSSAQAFRQDTLLGFYSGGGIPDTIIKSTDAGSGASIVKGQALTRLGMSRWFGLLVTLKNLPLPKARISEASLPTLFYDAIPDSLHPPLLFYHWSSGSTY